jgi:hypothetical protein
LSLRRSFEFNDRIRQNDGEARPGGGRVPHRLSGSKPFFLSLQAERQGYAGTGWDFRKKSVKVRNFQEEL